MSHNATIQSLSFYVTNVVGKLRLGIYTNGLDGPSTLLAQTDEITPTVGWNTVNIQTPVLLPTGDYWLAFLPENDGLEFNYEWIPGQYTGRVYGVPFGTMPSSITAQPIGVEYRFSFYATLLEDNSITPPETGILDDFNRTNGPIGSNWSGEASDFSISSNQLSVNTDNAIVVWNGDILGADQEAYETVSHLNTGGSSEHALVLKAQTSGERIEVSFFGAENDNRLVVWTYDNSRGWVQHGEEVYVPFVDGDIFAARARSDGIVEIFHNGALIALRSITDWPYYADGGSIGVAFYSAQGAKVDDFGGGSVSGGMMLSSTNMSSTSQTPASSEFILDSSQFNPTTDFSSTLLSKTQNISGQKASVILPPLNTTNRFVANKPQPGVTAQGSIQVLYDVKALRIQIFVYDSLKGWVQRGKDIAVKYVDGDRFSVLLNADGTLDIYCNGKLFVKRIVMS